MSGERVAREVVVHGQVQGVSFRDSCRAEAREAGVAGWVRNEGDGSVRAHLEGDPDAVDRVVDWCRSGPAHADVDHVDVRQVDVDDLQGFRIA